ncbi:hypothetical protein, partial [Aeromonas hydrophila]|uniref:hypothetical protein n=1 Tax=Aeromonas hydrophila TaxID=644 RepID=UPI003987CC7C
VNAGPEERRYSDVRPMGQERLPYNLDIEGNVFCDFTDAPIIITALLITNQFIIFKHDKNCQLT